MTSPYGSAGPAWDRGPPPERHQPHDRQSFVHLAVSVTTSFTVIVTDNGSPSLSTSQSFTLTVNS